MRRGNSNVWNKKYAFLEPSCATAKTIVMMEAMSEIVVSVAQVLVLYLGSCTVPYFY